MRKVLALAALAALVAVPPPAAARVWPQPAAGLTMTGDPELILTFDDGPHPTLTTKVLDALAKYHIKAIFFWVGHRSVKPHAPALMARALREGHIIANHTMNHWNLCELDDDVAAAEIDDGKRAVEAAAGIKVTWFRVPYGVRCDRVENMLAERGITHFHWDLDAQEWRSRNKKTTLEYLIKEVGRMKGRSVLLLHDTKRAAVEALPEFLAWLAAENDRRSEARLRRIRIIQAPEVALERIAPGLLDWLDSITPHPTTMSRAIASVLP